MTGSTYTDDTTWPDGTRKSTGNAFTSHGYVIGSPVSDKVPPNRKRGPRTVMAFGTLEGVIPNMGDRVPRKNQPQLARRAAA